MKIIYETPEMIEIDVRDAYLMCACSSDDANPYIDQIIASAYSCGDNPHIDQVYT